MVKGVAVGEFRKRNNEELVGELKRLRVYIFNLRKNYNKLDSQSNQVPLLLKFLRSKYYTLTLGSQTFNRQSLNHH
jgi:hypothetical protein